MTVYLCVSLIFIMTKHFRRKKYCALELKLKKGIRFCSLYFWRCLHATVSVVLCLVKRCSYKYVCMCFVVNLRIWNKRDSQYSQNTKILLVEPDVKEMSYQPSSAI